MSMVVKKARSLGHFVPIFLHSFSENKHTIIKLVSNGSLLNYLSDGAKKYTFGASGMCFICNVPETKSKFLAKNVYLKYY